MGVDNIQKTGIHFPKLGMRTIKTAICVFICLLINYLFMKELSFYSSIVAIVCMQSTIENTLDIAFHRLLGTAIGGGFGLLLLLLIESIGRTSSSLFLIVMPLGIIAVIYFCNVIKRLGSATIGAIVFVGIFAAPVTSGLQDVSPYLLAVSRILDTVLGVVVAMVINRYIAPARRYEPKTVHLSCDTYPLVYRRIAERLSGKEALILYDSSLICDGKKTELSLARSCPTARIPVPIEYSKDHTITVAYVDRDYTVYTLECIQENGYIEIPPHTLPCTVVWQL